MGDGEKKTATKLDTGEMIALDYVPDVQGIVLRGREMQLVDEEGQALSRYQFSAKDSLTAQIDYKETRELDRGKGYLRWLGEVFVTYLKEKGFKKIDATVKLENKASFKSQQAMRDPKTGEVLSSTMDKKAFFEVLNMIRAKDVNWEFEVIVTTHLEAHKLAENEVRLEDLLYILDPAYEELHNK